MASPGNWHCASCIGALSFRISPVRSCTQWSREVGGHCSRLGRVQGRRSHVFFWVRTHPLFRSWVWIGIGPTHFLRWIVCYCVCIQHDIDKSQISFIELRKTLTTNSGLRAINSCLYLFWPQLCKACWINIVLRQRNLKFSFHQQTVEFGPTHIFTQIYTPGCCIEAMFSDSVHPKI